MHKFTSFKNWLSEEKTQSKKTEYGCIMLYTQIANWERHLKLIHKEDIYDDEFNDYGLEHTPHCTVLFGINLTETEPSEVRKVMETFKPIKVMISQFSIFTNENYDVVKYDVPVTPELRLYHELVKKTFPNTQDFPDYHPHMTIAYVLPGTGKKYAQDVEPFPVTFNEAVYSFAAGNSNAKTRIKVKLESE